MEILVSLLYCFTALLIAGLIDRGITRRKELELAQDNKEFEARERATEEITHSMRSTLNAARDAYLTSQAPE